MRRSDLLAFILVLAVAIGLPELAQLLDPWGDDDDLSWLARTAFAVVALGAGWVAGSKLRPFRND